MYLFFSSPALYLVCVLMVVGYIFSRCLTVITRKWWSDETSAPRLIRTCSYNQDCLNISNWYKCDPSDIVRHDQGIYSLPCGFDYKVRIFLSPSSWVNTGMRIALRFLSSVQFCVYQWHLHTQCCLLWNLHWNFQREQLCFSIFCLAQPVFIGRNRLSPQYHSYWHNTSYK